ncbi:sulfatase family protein [Nitrosococcus oceani]|uniref:sulfatase family protein n=1 Tax=Nitrosococcus oceani TaxID=1229 RepID=UPI0004E8C383|nr:sulfatase [Nitrosococcus oceani]KFI23331.1 sulfatase [Nitrosococcus oceani]
MNKYTYTRRKFLKTLGFTAASIAVPWPINSSSLVSGREKQPPNVILIVADDMGYGDVGCYGNQHIKTPNLDALAKKGARFTDFHSNGPLCTPTRAALLTGCYQQRVGLHIIPKDQRYAMAKAMSLEEITFAEALKSVGYSTALVGKWHLGDRPAFLPPRQGFDEYFGIPYSHDMHPWRKSFPPLPLMRGEEIVELNPDLDHLTQYCTEEAVKFISKNKDRPFLLYMPHPMPHQPVHVSERFAQRFSKERLAAIKGEDKKSRKFLYSATIEEIDWSVGEIIKAVRALGIEENTFVAFTSDNGPTIGSAGPLKGKKGSLWEGGHRVPFIAYWQEKIRPGVVIDEITMSMDLFPTMAAMGRAPLPRKKIDGVNLLPLLCEGDKLSERMVFWRSKGKKAARRGPWKLLMQPARKKRPTSIGLYHLNNDLSEQHNLAEIYPEKLKSLQLELAAWEKYVDAGRAQKDEW